MYEEFMPYINVTEGLGRVMSMKKLYVKLLRSFLATTDINQILNVTQAIATGGDREAARNAVHALKGVTANLSINHCYERAAKLELAIKEGSPYAAIEPLLTELKQSLIETVPIVERLITTLETA